METGGITQTITATVTAPGWEVVLATGVFALAVTTSSFVLLVTGSRSFLVNLNVLGTAIHEAGHAAASCLTGGGVYQIEITGPESGFINHWYTSRFSNIATTAAGYAAPPLAGLGAASLLRREHAAAVLTLTVVAMFLILVVTRDLVTLGTVLVVGAMAFASLGTGAAAELDRLHRGMATAVVDRVSG